MKTPKTGPAVRRPKKAALPPATTPEEERFKCDLITRQEAVELSADGKLAPGATHVIVKKADGTTVIKRGRYNAF